MANRTKTIIVSRSRTMHPQSPALTIGGTVLKESDDLVIMPVTFDSKMTFEKHLRSVSRAATQRLGILRNSCKVYHDRLFLMRWFRGFVLNVLEYCSAVWCSAADTHLKLLDKVLQYKLQHRRIFIHLYSLWYDLGDLIFDGVGQASLKSRANALLLA